MQQIITLIGQKANIDVIPQNQWIIKIPLFCSLWKDVQEKSLFLLYFSLNMQIIKPTLFIDRTTKYSQNWNLNDSIINWIFNSSFVQNVNQINFSLDTMRWH